MSGSATYSPTSGLSLNVTRLDGRSFDVKGTVVPATPAWSSEVLVDYEAEDQLTGKQDFSGTVGPNYVNLEFKNGVIIRGSIPGGVYPGYDVEGSVTWPQKSE